MPDTSFSITLSDEQMTALRKNASANGMSDANSGQLPTEDGVSLSYVIDGDEIVFTILSKPWYIPVSMVVSQVHELIERYAQ